MSRVEEIENAIAGLSPVELAEFRSWFLEFDSAMWDQQLKQDAAAGRLDILAEEALRDLRASRTRRL